MMQTSFGAFPSENHFISSAQEPGEFFVFRRNFYENRTYQEAKGN